MPTDLLAQDQISNKLIGHAERVCPRFKVITYPYTQLHNKPFNLDGHEQIEWF